MTSGENTSAIPAGHNLVIGKKGKNQLSKPQQTFNRLNQKIKKLRAEIKDYTSYIDDCLAYYSTHIYPLEQRSIALRTEVVKLLYAIYQHDKSVAKKDRKTLKEVLLDQIDEIFSASTEHDDELKTIFNAISGENYDEVANSDFEAARKEMQKMFASMGLNIDISSIGKEDDMDTVMRKMQEQVENAKMREGNEQPEQRKTKKGLAREAKEKILEAAREQSIKNIYKQLVKALHPDLERDANLRIEKEALMQELTSAYKNNDLHTLLKLELSWLQHESDHLETLTDDKLSIYNQLLKEQVQDLEDELSTLSQHPRYLPLERFYNQQYLHKATLEAEPRRLEEINKSIEKSIHNLKNGRVKQELAELVAIQTLKVKMSEDPFSDSDPDSDWGDFFYES